MLSFSHGIAESADKVSTACIKENKKTPCLESEDLPPKFYLQRIVECYCSQSVMIVEGPFSVLLQKYSNSNSFRSIFSWQNSRLSMWYWRDAKFFLFWFIVAQQQPSTFTVKSCCHILPGTRFVTSEANTVIWFQHGTAFCAFLGAISMLVMSNMTLSGRNRLFP